MIFPNLVEKMTMLSRNRNLAQWSYLIDPESMFKVHSEQMIQNWYMYYGLHNLFLRRFEEEADIDFVKRVSEATIENHLKFIINTIVSYLYPNENSLKKYVKRGDDVDKELTDLLKEISFNHNKFATIDLGKALNTLITGYTVIQRQLYDIRTGNLFDSKLPTTEKAKYGYISKKIIDSSKCLLLPYISPDGVTDYTRLGAIVFYSESDNYVGIPDLMNLLQKTPSESKILEYVDDNVWLRWYKDKNKNWVQTDVNFGTKFVNKNPFGDIKIPFTVYKNFGDPFLLVGSSEVNDLKSLNLELNELGNGDKETIRYHQYPILLGLNGAKIPSNFVRTKNAVLESDKKDGKYEYLTWDGNLTASESRQESLRRMMSSVNGVSLISRAFLKDIGQIRSGPPLKALFNSDRNSMNLRFSAFQEGEKMDMKSDILYFDKICGLDHNLDRKVTFHADFDLDFLGIDALLNAEIRKSEFESGEDLQSILKSEHPDWTDEKINETVQNFLKQKQTKKMSNSVQLPDKKQLEQGN